MKVFFASVIVQTILSGYVFYHLWNVFSDRKMFRRFLLCLFPAEILLYFTGFFFYQELNDGFMYFLQVVCGAWFIGIIYFAIILLAVDGVRLLNRLFPFVSPRLRSRCRRLRPYFYSSCMVMVTVFLICGYYSFSHPKVKHRTIMIPKKAGNMKSLTIAFASDIHAGDIVNRAQLCKYVDLINAQHCDMIILGGDMIDMDLHPLNVQDMAAEFRRLQAPLGVYAILGNHEYRLNKEKKVEWLRNAGMTVLIDSVVMPGMSFYLIGRDDKRNPDRRSLDYLTTGLDMTKPVIVADHQPVNIGEAAMNQVDFTMHGHVHNGQLWPYNYIMKWYWDGFGEGYNKVGGTQVYVTSGLGLSGPPFRVFTDSEVMVFDIYFSSY